MHFMDNTLHLGPFSLFLFGWSFGEFCIFVDAFCCLFVDLMSFFSEGRVGRGRGRGKGGISKGRRMLRGHHCGPRFVLYILVHAIVSTTSFFFFFSSFFIYTFCLLLHVWIWNRTRILDWICLAMKDDDYIFPLCIPRIDLSVIDNAHLFVWEECNRLSPPQP